MHEVYDLRKQPNPQVSGLEAMVMVASSFFVDKKDHNAELKRILPELKSRALDRECGARLMIVEGNMGDEREFDEKRTMARIDSFMETLGVTIPT